MSSSDERRGHSSLEAIHYYSRNHGGHGNISLDTSHYSSSNCKEYHSSDVGICGYRSHENSHYSSLNCGKIIDVEGRGIYRSQISHSSSHNPGDRGRLLTSPFSSHHVDEKVYKIEKGDISHDDDDGRISRIHDDGESRGGYNS